MSFRDRIRAIASARGRHLAMVADFAGIGRTTMSRLVCGHSDPRASTLIAIARELGVPIAALFDDHFDGDAEVEVTIRISRRSADWLRTVAETARGEGAATTVAGVASELVGKVAAGLEDVGGSHRLPAYAIVGPPDGGGYYGRQDPEHAHRRLPMPRRPR